MGQYQLEDLFRVVLKICLQASFLFAELQFGSVKLQYIPIVSNRESIHCHGLIFAAPRLSYCGG